MQRNATLVIQINEALDNRLSCRTITCFVTSVHNLAKTDPTILGFVQRPRHIMELKSHKTSDCHLSYRGSIARIAVRFNMPDYRCAKLALVHWSERRRRLVMAKVFYLRVGRSISVLRRLLWTVRRYYKPSGISELSYLRRTVFLFPPGLRLAS